MHAVRRVGSVMPSCPGLATAPLLHGAGATALTCPLSSFRDTPCGLRACDPAAYGSRVRTTVCSASCLLNLPLGGPTLLHPRDAVSLDFHFRAPPPPAPAHYVPAQRFMHPASWNAHNVGARTPNRNASCWSVGGIAYSGGKGMSPWHAARRSDP